MVLQRNQLCLRRCTSLARQLPSVLLFPLLVGAQPAAPRTDGPTSAQAPSSKAAELKETAEPLDVSRSPAFGNSLANTPSFYGAAAPAGTGSLGTPGFAGGQASGGRKDENVDTPLRWGPFTAHPHLDYTFTYGTGLLFRPGESSDTALHSLAPGISILSRHLSLDYTPTLNYYSKGPYQDSVNHSASLAASFGYNDWRFGISQSYTFGSQPLIETGTQTTSEGFSTALSATWLFNEKIFFDFGITQQIQSYSGFQGSRNWSTMEWINYRLTQHLSIGAGVGGGYSEIDIGSDSTHEQIQGRLNWLPSAKLSVNLNGGIEMRQFLDSSESGSLVNPLMGVGVVYQLFDATSLSLSANRSVDSSLFANNINETTTIGGGISQRLFGRFHLGVSGGFRTTDYKNIGTGSNNRFLEVDRSDDSTYYGVSLSTSFLKRGNISFAYNHSNNSSSAGGFSYGSDQFTAQIGYRF